MCLDLHGSVLRFRLITADSRGRRSKLVIIPILDAHYGNVWTNIDAELFDQLGIGVGDSAWVRISDGTETLFEEKVRFVSSFGGVELGDPALYVNDILNIGLAVNQGNFAEKYGVEPGPDRNIEIWE